MVCFLRHKMLCCHSEDHNIGPYSSLQEQLFLPVLGPAITSGSQLLTKFPRSDFIALDSVPIVPLMWINRIFVCFHLSASCAPAGLFLFFSVAFSVSLKKKMSLKFIVKLLLKLVYSNWCKISYQIKHSSIFLHIQFRMLVGLEATPADILPESVCIIHKSPDCGSLCTQGKRQHSHSYC